MPSVGRQSEKAVTEKGRVRGVLPSERIRKLELLNPSVGLLNAPVPRRHCESRKSGPPTKLM